MAATATYPARSIPALCFSTARDSSRPRPCCRSTTAPAIAWASCCKCISISPTCFRPAWADPYSIEGHHEDVARPPIGDRHESRRADADLARRPCTRPSLRTGARRRRGSAHAAHAGAHPFQCAHRAGLQYAGGERRHGHASERREQGRRGNAGNGREAARTRQLSRLLEGRRDRRPSHRGRLRLQGHAVNMGRMRAAPCEPSARMYSETTMVASSFWCSSVLLVCFVFLFSFSFLLSVLFCVSLVLCC